MGEKRIDRENNFAMLHFLGACMVIYGHQWAFLVGKRIFRPEPCAYHGHGVALTPSGREAGGRMAEKNLTEKNSFEYKRYRIRRKRGQLK